MSGWGEVIGGPRVWARDLALAVAIGLTLAFIGPFGSYGRPLEQRILVCVGYGLAGSMVFWPLMRLFLRLGRRAGLPDPFIVLAGIAVATLPVSLVVRMVSPLLGEPVRTPLLSHYFGVLAVGLPTGLAYYLVTVLLAQRPRDDKAVPAAESPPRLLARLPLKTRGEVLALQAEDHYVRVHTTAGDALILMRLADAIAEADAVEGLRVHRSWWVAKAAVAAAKAEGRRAVLTLANGLSVPVTREAVPEIRRAGWL